VKDARNEAQKEIEDYKTEKENEYQKFDKEVRLISLRVLAEMAES
jgi:vacuolar-type H+-ATPase subunit H